MTEAIETWFYTKNDELQLSVDQATIEDIAEKIDEALENGFRVESLGLGLDCGDFSANIIAHDIFVDSRDYERIFGEIEVEVYLS